ncbi:sensor domain-containing diguanylate cyclase [Propionigenium maris]|nr:GGDEF domain-containing protein [Propionigenium maris]
MLTKYMVEIREGMCSRMEINGRKNDGLLEEINYIKEELYKEKLKLQRERKAFYFVKKLAKVIVSTNSIKEMSKKVYESMRQAYGECTIGIAVNSPERERVCNCFYHEMDRCLDFEDIPYNEKESKLLKTILHEREFLYSGERVRELTKFVGSVPRACYFAPLKMEKEVIGAFTYQSYERDEFSLEELEVCRELVPFMTIALNNTLQNKKILEVNRVLQKHSKYDELTGIYNRRYFYEIFEEKYRKAWKHGEKTFLYLMDLNNFKGVNDNFGHHRGDLALKRVGEILKGRFIGGDVGRFGGDEFLCGLTGITSQEALELAQRVTTDIHDEDISYNFLGSRVGISIGILELESGRVLRDYFKELDNNLYRAKRSSITKIYMSKE